MSKKELLEFAQTAHEENVKLSKRVKELESHNVKLESYNVKLANESHEYQERCKELESAITSNCYDDPSMSGKRLMALVHPKLGKGQE